MKTMCRFELLERSILLVLLIQFLSTESTARAQYANRYAKNSTAGSSYEVNATLPSKRSGYAHSAAALGSLSSEGYDDLAEFRPKTSADGQYRKPQAMERLDEETAVISTLNTGELLLLNLQSAEITPMVARADRKWSKILRLDSSHIAVIDLQSESVVVFEVKQSKFNQVAELSTYGHPHSMAWDATTSTLFVSGQWSQRLYCFQASDDKSSWQTLPHTDLPIHGGAMCWLPRRQTLIVVDAFGENFVALAGQESKQPWPIVNHSSLTGHNVPCIQSFDNENWIVFPFQLLNPETYSVQGDITWGGLMSNNIRWLQADRMLTKQNDEVIKQGKFIPLGQVGNGAGDPTSLQFGPNARIAVTLGGIDRVAVGRVDQRGFQKYPTGLHPIARLFSTTGSQLFVLNEFSDSVTRIDLETEGTTDIPLGPIREMTLVERGERLFFHSSLAHDGWMSCHSCHSRGHTSGQLNDNTSDGSLGTPKRILSLLGQAETAPYSWTGEIAELEVQVLNSIQSTMATDFQISKFTIDAISAYVRSLPAPPSVRAARRESSVPTTQLGAATTPQNRRGTGEEAHGEGRQLFEQLHCVNCHAGSQFTNSESFDVDLEDQRGQRSFNPPSLIGLSQRSRILFHDGRAKSIQDVLGKFKHQMPRELSDSEAQLLANYLEGL